MLKKDQTAVFPVGKWIVPPSLAGIQPVDIYDYALKNEPVTLPESLKNRHFLIRKRFLINEIKGQIRLRITADDYYKLSINGRFVGQGPAQGYSFCYYWNEYDVTGFLKEGVNELCAHVYYQGLINRAYQSGDRRMGLIAELYSGNKCLLSTDTTWESRLLTGYTWDHIIGYDTMFSENFDSRVKPEDWEPCCEMLSDYQFSPEPAVPLQVYEKLPVQTETLPDGGILYDFGEEITGVLRVTASGKAGAKLRLLFGEELEESPVKVRYRMRCNCVYDESWTLAEGGGVYEGYDYKGFRYAAVLPEPGVTVESVLAVVRHYPFDDGYCRLETDSPVLKQVWDICKKGVKYGAQEIFVDCPTREKGQYAGDLTVTSASHLVLTGDPSLLKKSIDNQMQSTHIFPGILAVTPGSFVQKIADYSFQFPILALRYYEQTGDRAYLKETLQTCEKMIGHYKKYARQDGLLCGVKDEWNLVDWPEGMRDGYDFPPEKAELTEPHAVLNAFYLGCVKQTEQIRDILGMENKRESPTLVAAFNREFYREATGLYVDRRESSHSSLHANVLPLFYGLCPEESQQRLGDFIMEKGLCCGVYMSYFVLKALCRVGRYRDAYALIVSETEHSWYHMVQEGASTCFEAWGKEQKHNTSLCHPWASAPVSVLAEDILPHMPEIGRLVYSRAIR